MLFDSTIFLFVFLPVSIILYYLTPAKFKNLMLVFLSALFYAWGEPVHLILLVFVTIWNYIGGKYIAKGRRKGNVKTAAFIVIGIDVLLFAVFKYAGYCLQIAGNDLYKNRFFLVPIGISFFMLQNIAYIIDIYRGDARVQKSLQNYAVLIMMFPKVIAGPLVSYNEFEKQITKRKLSRNKFAEGILMFVRGLAKKVILGNAFMEMYEVFHTLPSEQMSVLNAWIGCLAFAAFLFFSFGGYCDMAAGLGKVFGFDFPENMNYPCMATGIMDYWSRWISTLWKWFCSYVYWPLCGGNPGGARGFFALLATWILIGLWHGLNATFIIWGIYFAILLYIEGFVLGQALEKVPVVIRWIVTMLLLMISFVFFFSPSMKEAVSWLKLMFGIGGSGFIDSRTVSMIITYGILWISGVLFGMPWMGKIYARYRKIRAKQTKKNKRKQSNRKQIAALIVLGMLLLSCLFNLAAGNRKITKPEATVSRVLNGQYAKEYEQYFSERFAGKEYFRRISHSVETLLGKRESNGVYKGKKHHLAEKIEPFRQDTVEQNVEAIKEFDITYYNIPAYIMLVPDAANIHSDMLPPSAVTENQSEQFAEIKKMFDGEISWVDTETILREHKDEKIYYCTDEHWTTLGAYYGYEALSDAMDLDRSQAPELKSYVVNNDYNGSLSEKSGYENGYKESVSIYSAKNVKDNINLIMTDLDTNKKSASLYDSSKLEKKDKYALFLGGDHGILDIETTVDTSERLLVIKDSYANCMIPFLVSHFREIVVIDPDHYSGNLQEVMENVKFTKMLFLYSGNSFVTDENMSKILN